MRKSERGAIHFFAILACVLALATLVVFARWMRQSDHLVAKVQILEKSVEALDSKLKLLELKVAADELVKHDDIVKR